MRTTIEYNSKLALGDEIVFYLDGEKFTGRVSGTKNAFWLNFLDDEHDHEEVVDKIFSHFGISDKYEFRSQVIGYDREGDNGIWPYTNSLEELKKMLDEL